MHRTRTPEDILVHQFLLKVAENAGPAVHKFREWLKTAGKQRSSGPHLLPDQSYHARVFWRACRLSHLPREIKACEIFIANTPSGSYLNRFGFGQRDYIHNQYHAYLTLVESSHDWALRLCHSVFNLGEPRVEFDDPLVLADEWLKRTGVGHELEQLAVQANAVRERRQEIVTPTMIRKVNLITEPFLGSFLNLGLVEDRPIPTVDRKRLLLDTVSSADISKLVGHVARQRSDLTETIDALLDGLLPVYEKWTGVFSSVKY